MDEALFLDSAVEFVGPIEHHAVVVNGYRVPHLTATPVPGGRVELLLDNRMAVDIPVHQADEMVAFIADCIAVAMGFTSHPQPGSDGPRPRHPFQRMTRLDLVTD